MRVALKLAGFSPLVMPAIRLKQDFTSKNKVSYAQSNATDAKRSSRLNRGKAADTVAEYKENLCGSMAIGIGPRIHEECPYSPVNHSYAATGETALQDTINTSYKRVFGNVGITDNQRLASLEAELRDGRLKVRDFVAGLAKSELYKNKFFHAVSPIRGIELTLKHLLGRPPITQAEVATYIKLIAAEGFDSFIDKIVTSGEYIETFGLDTVPYFRAFKSEARAYCSTFVGMAEVTPANASSDNALLSASMLVRSLNVKSGFMTTVRRSMPQQGVFDNTPFSYSQATRNSSSASFQRMYGSANQQKW